MNKFTNIFISIIICFCISFSQEINKFQYISPLPNSLYASTKCCIIIKPGEKLDNSTISNNLILVYGSKSGEHEGEITLSDDGKTITFQPSTSFLPNEYITVYLQKGLKTLSGENIDSLEFKFKTWEFAEKFNNKESLIEESQYQNYIGKKSANQKTLTYPFPIIKISTDPSPGYIFSAPSSYIMITDNQGVPIFYRNIGGGIYDFDLQPDGELTYFEYPTTCYGLDSSYNKIRKYVAGQGYGVDVHDLIVLPNGHYYILGKILVHVDMNKIVSGGDSTAEIIDMALQEFDSNGTQIFQWSAINHYKITDADSHINLTDHVIDFVHLNSIEFDSDSNIIISARNLDEVTKIDHNTGNIIWRLGGKNNQFTFVNDPLGFSRQHDVKKLSNGDLSLFDNGVYHNPSRSSFVEYKIDTQDTTATLVRRYTHNDEVYSMTRGNAEELPNGNMIIGWGESDNPALTEVTPNDSIVYELSFPSIYQLYRSFRYKWKTNLFRTNVDTIKFGKVAYTDSAVQNVTLFNPHDSVVTVNQFYCEEPSYSIKETLPLDIPPHDSIQVSVQFKPRKHGIFDSNLNLRYITSNELIARQVLAEGSTFNLPIAIPSPSNLTANREINGNVALSWTDNSNDENGFVIERKRGDSLSTNQFLKIDSVKVNDTTYEDNSTSDSLKYTYSVYAYNIDTTSSISNKAEVGILTSIRNDKTIHEFYLYQNYPNPFNPTTLIKYSIPTESYVKIIVYNMIGQEIETLVNSNKNAGSYQVEWNAENLSSGIYFYSINALSKNGGKNFYKVRKMILLK